MGYSYCYLHLLETQIICEFQQDIQIRYTQVLHSSYENINLGNSYQVSSKELS